MRRDVPTMWPALATLVLVIALPGLAAAQQLAAPTADDFPGWTERLDYAYTQIEAAYEADPDGDAWRDIAAARQVPVDADGRVRFHVDANAELLTWVDGVQVNVPDEIPAALKEELLAHFNSGGLGEPDLLVLQHTTSTTRFDGWAHPAIVAPLFQQLQAALPHVGLRRPVRPVSTFGAVNSQGVAAMNLSSFHSFGVQGDGVAVAVIDLEFGGISTLSGETGPFFHHPTQANLNSDSGSHGTACLEILRDTAPGIGPVWAIREASGLDMQTIVDFLQSQSPAPQVISHSTAYFGYPGNGGVSDAVRDAVGSGMFWCVSSGNFSDEEYWEASSPSLSGNLVEFSSGVTGNTVQTFPGQGTVGVVFSYEKPNASFADLRVVLYRDSGGGFQPVDTGDGNSFSQFVTVPRVPGSQYAIGIEMTAAGTIGRMRLQVTEGRSEFQFFNVEGSMTNPAVVAEDRVLSVGAVPVSQYNAGGSPAGYSSRGGGVFALHLDLCGPTDISTSSFGTFSGTSAAAPGVAGLMACILSHPPFQADPLAARAFIDIGVAGADDVSGEGIVGGDLSALTGTLADKNEPNDTRQTATFIGTNPKSPAASSGVSIYNVGDVDWYSFTITETTDVLIETSGPAVNDTIIALVDSAGTTLRTDDDGQGVVGGYSRITMELIAGQYFVEVRDVGDNDTVANYTLNVVVNIDDGGCAFSSRRGNTSMIATLLGLLLLVGAGVIVRLRR